MPKQKYYAIKTPNESKIVMTWAECEKLTHGVKGVLFKSFGSRAEAEAWISGMEAPVPDGIRVFVDGSFSPDFPKSGWAFVVTENDVEIARGSGITKSLKSQINRLCTHINPKSAQEHRLLFP